MRRLLLGFALAPAIPGLVMLAISILTGRVSEGIWAFGLMSMVTYAVAVVVGIPAFFLLSKAKINGLIPYIAVGQLLSVIPVAYFILLPAVHLYGRLELFHANYLQIALIAFIGLIVTIAFWLIARPDKPAV